MSHRLSFSSMSRYTGLYTEDDSYFDGESETDNLLHGASERRLFVPADGSDTDRPTVPFIRAAPPPVAAECPAFDAIVRAANAVAGPGLLAIPFVFQHEVGPRPAQRRRSPILHPLGANSTLILHASITLKIQSERGELKPRAAARRGSPQARNTPAAPRQ